MKFKCVHTCIQHTYVRMYNCFYGVCMLLICTVPTANNAERHGDHSTNEGLYC